MVTSHESTFSDSVTKYNSLVLGAAYSCIPWTRTADGIWAAEALWYTSLICAISAIITSIQAKSILDDLPSLEQLDFSLPETEVQRMQRTILRYKKTPGIKYWAMVFIWQYVLVQIVCE